MGVALVGYSSMPEEFYYLLKKKSMYGFFVPETRENPPTIYYNDMINSKGLQRFTVFHELKHYVFEDENEEEDDLADYFSKYFMCPIPYLLLKNIDSPNEVVSRFGTSLEAAGYICANVNNRRNKYGYRIFDYEVELIEHLEPILLEIYAEQ